MKEHEITDEKLLAFLPGFKGDYVDVNGIKMYYVRGGTGVPLILLPGWPQTWWAYHKIMPLLSEHFDVIAVDIRGMGNSDKPSGGYDKKTMASDLSTFAEKLNLKKVNVAGHDIGAAVAYSFAVNHPGQVEKLILIDLLHPEESVSQLTLIPPYGTFNGETLDPTAPFLWWWAFLQVKNLPELLMEGRAKLLYEWFFNNTLGDQESITSFDRAVYYAAYESEISIKASNKWFQAFAQDINDQKSYSKLELPVLGIGGGSYNWMNAVLPGKTTHLSMAEVENCGHFPTEEKPEVTAKFIIEFLNKK